MIPQHIYHLQIKWNISPVSQYLKVADSMRYYQDQYISKLQISWDTSPGSQYFTVADIMRYFTKILLSHSWRSNEIFHKDDIISSLFLCMFVLLSHCLIDQLSCCLVVPLLPCFTFVRLSSCPALLSLIPHNLQSKKNLSKASKTD